MRLWSSPPKEEKQEVPKEPTKTTRKADESDRIAFRAQTMMQDILSRQRTAQESAGTVAKRDLERYYAMLRRSLETVVLAEEEAKAVVHALRGEEFNAHSFQLFWAAVDDAVRKRTIPDAESFVGLSAKLRALNFAEKLAIVDAVEKLRGEAAPDKLRAVGLIR
jgi:hypothetical protein